MSGSDLGRLADLAGILRDRDLAALADLAVQAQQLRQALADQAAAVAARSAAVRGLPTDDVALTSGRDAGWIAALDRRRAALMAELAGVLARQESVRAKAARSLGRADVLGSLSLSARRRS